MTQTTRIKSEKLKFLEIFSEKSEITPQNRIFFKFQVISELQMEIFSERMNFPFGEVVSKLFLLTWREYTFLEILTFREFPVFITMCDNGLMTKLHNPNYCTATGN